MKFSHNDIHFKVHENQYSESHTLQMNINKILHISTLFIQFWYNLVQQTSTVIK